MYSLLISALEGQWRKTAVEIELSRCVREYTDDVLSQRYGTLDAMAIGELLTFPCLFGYETGVKGRAQIGWLKAVKPRGDKVRIEYEIEKALPTIGSARLKALSSELDIGSWELTRIHWALKDVDLLPTLISANILTDDDVQKQNANSRLIRFGMSKPISELNVRPSVFRVPSAKPQENLISVMMPFDETFDRVYAAIRSAAKRVRLECKRADNVWDHQEVIQDIFSLIYLSRVVVCDFSKRNPNVFYEAGIAHTLGKLVIPIVQNEEDIPFDLKHMRYIKYMRNSEGLEELTDALAQKLKTSI